MLSVHHMCGRENERYIVLQRANSGEKKIVLPLAIFSGLFGR